MAEREVKRETGGSETPCALGRERPVTAVLPGPSVGEVCRARRSGGSANRGGLAGAREAWIHVDRASDGLGDSLARIEHAGTGSGVLPIDAGSSASVRGSGLRVQTIRRGSLRPRRHLKHASPGEARRPPPLLPSYCAS